ncbi:nucleoside-diphosphate kinase [Streptomyces sp. NBC_00557]|uniref:nucleoside-diphosphate kinase n=1 Tax=Streptomyces sp. NBC_00557 TaxID=2975776 RepID=UPI002E8247E5|nr:nucleoside-diphosphate kinase [Streptomyces sp. NBC_00557]WUC33036.1 nucleoside-diphosphate kinase [Streptomyces sp. NBC_00557]
MNPAHPTEPAHGIPVSPLLTCHPAKQRLYGADTYFQESHDQLAALTDDVTGFAHRHAALLLKPDAVVARRLEAAVDWLTEQRFRIVGAAVTRLTRTMIRSLWYFQWNLATPYRRRLAALFLEDADALVLLVRPEDEPVVPASVELTRLKGPTDPDARRPGQLRHLLGRYSYLLNLVHTPDEPADVLRELAVHFDDGTREQLFRSALAGEDRTAHALELTGRLYAATKPRDLDFDPAVERLRDTLSRHPGAAPGDATPRALLESAWERGVDLDPWDAVIVGSKVLPMRVPGRAPVLDGADAGTWRRHLDALRARHT